MNQRITAIGLLAASMVYCSIANSQDLSVHASRLPTGHPATNRTLHGHLYCLSINPETKLADWCAYRVTAADFASRNSIDRRWINGLAPITLEYQDYANSPYDMGHLVPLGSYSSSVYAYELNFMANVAPQTPQLNRGPWLQLERSIREETKSNRWVDVIVGPLYELGMPILPDSDEPHKVPSHYWAIVRPSGGEPIAYIMPQSAGRSDSIESYIVDVTVVESRSGLKLGGS